MGDLFVVVVDCFVGVGKFVGDVDEFYFGVMW